MLAVVLDDQNTEFVGVDAVVDAEWKTFEGVATQGVFDDGPPLGAASISWMAASKSWRKRSPRPGDRFS